MDITVPAGVKEKDLKEKEGVMVSGGIMMYLSPYRSRGLSPGPELVEKLLRPR